MQVRSTSETAGTASQHQPSTLINSCGWPIRHLGDDYGEVAEMGAAGAVVGLLAVAVVSGHGPLRELARFDHDRAHLVLLAQQAHKRACQAHVCHRV